MLNPFTCENLVIKSKWVTWKKGTMNRSVWGVNCLPHFSNPLPLLPESHLPQTQAGLHTAYHSVPHVHWSTKPPPVPHEIFISQCRRKSCDVRDSSCSVLFLHGRSDTAAKWGNVGRGFQIGLLQGLNLDTCPVNCEIRVHPTVYHSSAWFLFTNLLSLSWLVSNQYF